jgi:hypothetical protein
MFKYLIGLLSCLNFYYLKCLQKLERDAIFYDYNVNKISVQSIFLYKSIHREKILGEERYKISLFT